LGLFTNFCGTFANEKNPRGSFVHPLMMNILARKFCCRIKRCRRLVWRGDPAMHAYTSCFTLLE